MGRLVVEAGVGDLDVRGDLVVEAEVFVNIRSRDLTGGNGADGAGGAGDTVAPGENVAVFIQLAAVLRGNAASR